MTDDELKGLFETLRQENIAAHVETRQYVDRSAAETREYVDRSVDRSAAETREYVDRSIDQSAAETRRQFEATAERLESKIELVAESVVRVDEKIDRETAAIREEMRRGFADTHALINFAYVKLDQRIRVLEERG